MDQHSFFLRSKALSIAEIVDLTGAQAPAGADITRLIQDVAPFATAGADEVSFLIDRKLLLRADATAGACFVAPPHAARLPAATTALVTPYPEAAFARTVAALYPDAAGGARATGTLGNASNTSIDPTARLESDVAVEPGVVIGPDAEIGAGTVICANAVIGRGVRIGRRCLVGPGASVLFAIIGNDVIIHAGAKIGDDGFGYAAEPRGFVKLPQIGRVIIQDHVEIGANSTVDRGALGDTVIGEGTKIDNLVQIAHNVSIGRWCAFAGQVGLSGSTRVGDRVVMGGQAGTMPHVTVGNGVQVAGGTGIAGNVAAGSRVAGRPHRPFDRFLREMHTVARLVRREQFRKEASRDGSLDE